MKDLETSPREELGEERQCLGTAFQSLQPGAKVGSKHTLSEQKSFLASFPGS